MKRILVFWITAFFFACCVSAGFTMDLKTTSESLSDREARINFSLKNSGDEVAYNIRLEPIVPEGFESKVFYLNYLPPDQPSSGSFNVEISPNVLEGEYPVALILHYADRNAYPFSVVFPEVIKHRKKTTSMVLLSIPTVEMTSQTPVEFDVKVFNQDFKKHNITVRLYLPEELSADFETKNVEVNGRARLALDNRVWSAGALYDSDYLVLASVSYIENNSMYSSMALGRVRVVKPAGIQIGGNIFAEAKWILLAFVLLVVIVLSYLTFRERPRTKDEKEGKKTKKGVGR